MDFHWMQVSELQQQCRNRGLSDDGRKPDLITRLLTDEGRLLPKKDELAELKTRFPNDHDGSERSAAIKAKINDDLAQIEKDFIVQKEVMLARHKRELEALEKRKTDFVDGAKNAGMGLLKELGVHISHKKAEQAAKGRHHRQENPREARQSKISAATGSNRTALPSPSIPTGPSSSSAFSSYQTSAPSSARPSSSSLFTSQRLAPVPSGPSSSISSFSSKQRPVPVPSGPSSVSNSASANNSSAPPHDHIYTEPIIPTLKNKAWVMISAESVPVRSYYVNHIRRMFGRYRPERVCADPGGYYVIFDRDDKAKNAYNGMEGKWFNDWEMDLDCTGIGGKNLKA